MKVNDDCCLPTNLHEGSVSLLLALGWKWDGSEWQEPAALAARQPEVK